MSGKSDRWMEGRREPRICTSARGNVSQVGCRISESDVGQSFVVGGLAAWPLLPGGIGPLDAFDLLQRRLRAVAVYGMG
jgi:hypothetical protein